MWHFNYERNDIFVVDLTDIQCSVMNYFVKDSGQGSSPPDSLLFVIPSFKRRLIFLRVNFRSLGYRVVCMIATTRKCL